MTQQEFVAAAIQLGPASASIAETAERILRLLDQAAAQGVRLAVLPELAFTPYFAATVFADDAALLPFTAPEENARALDLVQARAARHGMAVVVSYAEQTAAGLYNTMAFIDGAGQVQGRFRKMHIPGETEPDPALDLTILEKRYFQPGDLGFGAFDLGPVRAGGLICYDRRFPESYRALAGAGADLICVGYNTPVMNGGTLARARAASRLAICGGAYQNLTHAIAAGKAGREWGVDYIADSFICSPEGEVLAHADTDGDEVVTAVIDLAARDRIRRNWGFLQNRRMDAYPAEPVPAPA